MHTNPITSLLLSVVVLLHQTCTAIFWPYPSRLPNPATHHLYLTHRLPLYALPSSPCIASARSLLHQVL